MKYVTPGAIHLRQSSIVRASSLSSVEPNASGASVSACTRKSRSTCSSPISARRISNPLQLPQNAGGGATGATLTALLTNFSETSLKPRHPSRRVFLGEPSASSDSKHGQHASRLRLKPSRANNLVVESSPL